MTLAIDGATRLYFIVGDPIIQVKSPAGMSHAFQRRGINAAMLPAQVAPEHLTSFLGGIDHLSNCDGIVVTVPHKFACFEHCATVSDRAALLRAVNVMRRSENGHWHGDMLDGLGFVKAAEEKGGRLQGKKALLLGAGGAGSAIALALLDAGLASLAIHDLDTARRDGLIEKLRTVGREIHAGSPNPEGFDVVANATPAGMKGHDYMPVEVSRFDANMFVGCVVTESNNTPLIAAARGTGCSTANGIDMYAALENLMVEFFQGGSKL
ncbi:shikimate dehydrogenase [Rhizobium altiplani]|uniref:Shikimate dehydrogenase n=1 Tax=Rhizobium altiplani TaxID=1864509 RepID=A0A109JU23_9HYPH|nr:MULTISPECIES: shikimate dehydrogenase [Rhizobium]KWV55150.1 shikimate dehydrogenase [Rhizobium altiplani]